MTPTPAQAAPLKRKIAAILAADVAGYSRLVAADEEGTLRALAAARTVFDARVAAGGGRIFNTAGDSVMCEFDSAVEAVRAAIDIQARLAEAPAKERLSFRVGITIGDVVERGGDLLGDGVNIAARLEALATPGGICVSRSVHESVAGKVAVSFQDLGARPVKNLPQPIHAFLIAAPIGSPAEAGPAPAPSRRPRLRQAAWAALVLVTVAAPVAYWLQPGPASTPLPNGIASGPPAAPPPVERRTDAPPAEPVRAAATPAAPKPPRASPRGDAAADTVAFAALTRDGAPASPKTVPEFYALARVLDAKGDRAGALRAYAAAAPVAGEAVDFHVRHAALLRAANGGAAARQSLAELARRSPSRSLALAMAAGLDGPDRRGKLEELAAAGDLPPADYLLADALLSERGPGPTLTDRRLAYAALDRFIEGAGGDALPRFFIDRTFLDGWLETARRRRGEVEAHFTTAAARPSVSYTRNGAGWTGRLSLPEPATAVSIRLGEGGEFASTGSSRALDARTGRPAPNADFTIPAGTGRTAVYVMYTDRSGQQAGPFPLTFDPASAIAEAGRDVLERFPDSWVAFRPDLPDLLSFAGLVSNRCAIARATIGYGDDPPRDPLPLPPCDATGPSAMPAGATVVRLPGNTDTVQVQLTYADGSESTVRTFRRP